MGKLLIIILLLVTIIFTAILVSLQNKSGDIADLLSSNMSEIKAKSLSNEALIYGIKQLSKGNLSVSETELKQAFSNFDVLDGTIDSIKYVMYGTGDTLRVTSFVTAIVNGKQTQYQSLAEIYYNDSNPFENIITDSDELHHSFGHSYIVGIIEENVDLVFETIFGITMEQMRAIADNDYTNPSNNVTPVNGITYIELTDNNKVHFTNHHWSGSGILIVDGDFQMTGGTFEGIVWVNGRIQIAGNALMRGSMFISEDPNNNQLSHVTGNCDLYYDQTIVQQLLGTYNISVPDNQIKILTWNN
ncbi:MAG: hypothetical protein P9M11_08725 [Candidatus Tenebribacter burtonii]|nr:hypothetical protein [Candidatus Tenebribacter burtonii]